MSNVPDKYSGHRMAIQMLLSGLDDRIAALCDNLEDNVDYIWTENATYPASNEALHCVSSAIRKLEYDDEELAVGDNANIQAVVACNEKLMALVEDVNSAKLQLKAGFAEVTNYRVKTDEGILPLSQVILRSLARARYKRQEAYRQLFCFNEIPLTIGFSSSLIRTVAKRTPEEILIWLSRQSGGSDSSYYHDISNLPFDTSLAVVKGRYNSLRANIKFADRRQMVPASLPIFIPLKGSRRLDIRRPKPREDTPSRQTRSDTKLEDQPLFTLGAISVYQYKEH